MIVIWSSPTAFDEILCSRQDLLDRYAIGARRVNLYPAWRLENTVAGTTRKRNTNYSLPVRRAPRAPFQRVKRAIEPNHRRTDHHCEMDRPAVDANQYASAPIKRGQRAD